ncbi:MULTISPECIES: MFS transporter [Arthrobacter]|uniref:MFS transporter n=1 Tax=Arthrobacter TaxID=1663 RepID=UPI001404B2B8|nr:MULTISPECIES: MFS transporter [Arthrobacter]MBT8162574.1 MFS transporter [Arthrobacter sp. GN70]
MDRAITRLTSLAISSARFSYFAAGYSLACWYSQVPAVRERLGLNDLELGCALTIAPLTTLISTFLYGRLSSDAHKGRRLSISLVLLSTFVLGIGLADSKPWLFISLVLLGISNCAVQIESNSRAHLVEDVSRKSFSLSCHGFYSVGVAVAGVLATIIPGNNAGPPMLLFSPGLVVLVGLGIFRIQPIQEAASREAAEASWSERTVRLSRGLPIVLLPGLGMVLLALESTVNGWHSALALENDPGADWPGIIFAAYGTGSLLIRFTGDFVRRKYGLLTTFVVMFPVSFSCFAIYLMTHSVLVLVVFFFLLGVALGIAYPDALRLASLREGSGSNREISTVIKFGTLGVVLSNPAIGLTSEFIGVGGAFLVLNIVALVAAGPVAVKLVSSAKEMAFGTRRESAGRINR